MQKMAKILIVAGVTVGVVQAGGMQKYGVKSAKVEYEIKGAGNIMGMGKIKEIGKKRLIFDNYGVQTLEEKSKVKKETIMGKTKVRKNHTLTYMNGAVVYKVDFKKKKIIRINSGAGAMAGIFASGKNLKDNGEAMLKKMGGKKIGTDKVAGFTCDVWTIMGAKQCIYKGIPLKVEVNVMGIKSTEIATKAEFDISLSKDDFKLPDFPIYSMNMNNGKQTKLNRDELEEQDKLANKEAQVKAKEGAKALKGMGAGLEAAKKAGYDPKSGKDMTPQQKEAMEKAMMNAMGGESTIVAKMKKEMLQEFAKLPEAKSCLENADTKEEANSCEKKIFGDKAEHHETWTKRDKANILHEMEQAKKAEPCIKSANTFKALKMCMPH